MARAGPPAIRRRRSREGQGARRQARGTLRRAGAPAYATDGRWWRIYGDVQLDRLVDEAFSRNTDLAEAIARVDEARALVGEAEAALLPTVDGNLRGERSRAGRQVVVLAPGALDEQVALTKRTLALRESSLALQMKRADAGLVSDFDYRQLEAEAAAARAELPGLERNREVRVALAAQSRARETYDALAEALRLARLRHDNGVASQLDVIDAERGLLAAELGCIDALRAQRAAVADLFRALGG